MKKCLDKYCEVEHKRSLPFCSEQCSNRSFSRTARREIAKQLPKEYIESIDRLSRKAARLIQRGCHYGSGLSVGEREGTEDRDDRALSVTLRELADYFEKCRLVYPDLTRKEFNKWIMR